MRRIAVISSFILAACDVGTLPGTGTDGGGGGSDTGSGSNCEPIAATPPTAPATHTGDGRDTQACLASGCHNAVTPGAGAPPYSYAGTVYKDPQGAERYPGATILVEIGGTTHKVVAADNGMFWMVPALVPGPTTAMTAKTSGSACPNTIAMGGLLTNAAAGDCNSGNCHAPGSAQGPVYVTP